ncbi:hypothetical protein HK414_12040 [Ramlibacter terrae]|uniref:Clathrin/coatomer adaptor adaptin-like N-terminal domain-containing protein n=1 Tax=Ramlibacter terrae TaxID=2732511 RepID=A0ABX6P2E0_9BURK|nr:hypothetical protein HK414_12040 [Ramlibacter terrae]
MARAESKSSLDAAKNRLVAVALLLLETVDIGTQVEGFARMLDVVSEIDVDGSMEKDEGLKSLCRDGLAKNLDVLLIETAYQFDVLKGVIRAYAESDPHEGLALCMRLNTVFRRDEAIVFFVKNYVTSLSRPISCALLLQCIAQIVDVEASAEALLTSVSTIAKRKPALADSSLPLVSACRALEPRAQENGRLEGLCGPDPRLLTASPDRGGAGRLLQLSLCAECGVVPQNRWVCDG